MNTNDTPGAVMQVLPFCLNRQAAIAFTSFKPSYFDEHVRPQLSEFRAGTSVLYLREELEHIVRKMFRGDEESEPVTQERREPSGSQETNTGERKWEKRQAASFKPTTAAGKSTSTSTGYDFTNALKVLKTRKAG